VGYRGQELPIISDFSGGQNSTSPPDTIDDNQGIEAKNIIVLPRGRGFRMRQGDTAFNSSAMVSGSTAVSGIHYYKQADGDEWLTAVAGAKFFKSDSLDGTMDDATGAITITAGQNNIWQMFTFNDIVISVGGAPDAPFKWTGSGNAAALGGSPPSGNFGFQHNNRIFIGNTTSNPSRLQWSVLGDPENWSGDGSGFQDVWTSDNDNLVGASIINSDIVLLFKENSIHQLITREHPFPVFPLFKNIGAVGKSAIVTVGGICYFITADGKMAVTDGTRIITSRDLPRLDDVDDLWSGLNSSRRNSIFGVPYRGKDFKHIYWFVSNGSATTHDLCIVWDVDNQCWVQFTTGYTANVATATQAGVLYGGHYDGKIYKKDVGSTFTDASNGGAGIESSWKGKWMNLGTLENIKQVDNVNVALESKTSGQVQVNVGADYQESLISENIGLGVFGDIWGQFNWGTGRWGGTQNFIGNILSESIRGNVIQVSFKNEEPGNDFRINSYSFSGKIYGRKEFTSQ